MTTPVRITLGIAAAALLPLAAAEGWSQQPESPPVDTGVHIMISPTDIKWSDGPPILPPGAKMAIIEGKPSEPGLFTLRLKLPAGYRVPPHWHPADEHVTVISGNFRMGVGEKFDEKALHDLPIGGFAIMVRGTRHFAQTKGPTVIQIHAMGPWGLNYVNAADDPRQARKQ